MRQLSFCKKLYEKDMLCYFTNNSSKSVEKYVEKLNKLGIKADKEDFITSTEATIYYLKKYSNEWKIVSDYVINEKSALRYGIARFLPMQLDAPSIMTPDTQYTAIVKMNLPSKYIALVSINNEVITQQHIKSDEVFRSVKSSGIRERVLTSNDGSKNENAVASIGIVQSEAKDDNINIEIVGMAFLSSRVNVIKHKLEDTDIEKVAKDKKVNNDKKE